MFVKLENNQPVEWPINDWQIRAARPNDSLPEYITDDLALELGFGAFVVNGYPPEYNDKLQNIEEIAPILKEDGKYHQSYNITEKYTAEEKQQILADEAKLTNESQAKRLLQESDWVEYPSTSDVTKTPHLINLDEWVTYRVALRAIAINPPSTEITDWPAEPSKQWSTQ